MQEGMSRAAWIKTIDEAEADEALRAAYEQCVDKSVGRVAHIMKVHSLNPPAMLNHRALFKTLMFGPSPLQRYQREMIGTVVSALHHCHY